MKFGYRLAEQRKPEWEYYYIKYDLCKRFLKNTSSNLSEVDEAAFVEILDRELEKVASFRKMKGDELSRRVSKCERSFSELCRRFPSISELVSSPVLGASTEETMLVKLREEVNKILTEVGDLSKYTRLNYAGFMKILKKHDRYTQFQLKPTFLIRMRERPFYEESVDSLIIRLSRIFQNVRTGGKGGLGTDMKEDLPDRFVRKTTKYWVHYDKVDDLRNQILKKIPILIVKDKKGSIEDVPNPAVSTVYLDNESFDLFHERVERKAGSQLIRLRWYGDMDASDIFVERKVLKWKARVEQEDEDETTVGKPVPEHSIFDEETEKSRFTVKETKMNDYLAGRYKMDKSIQKQNEKLVLESVQSPTFGPLVGSVSSRTAQSLSTLQSPSLVATTTRTAVPSSGRLESLARLSNEISNTIQSKKLRPVLRTFYNRTAFQVPGDLRVRISLDTELTFIREDNMGRERSGNNWRRPDCGATWPFDYLDKADVDGFPYAILEVKIQMVEGGSEPDWVKKLVNDSMIREVPTFSKYVHGVAHFFENKIVSIPPWMTLIEKEFGISGGKRLQPSDVLDSNGSLIASQIPSPMSRGVNPVLESRRPTEAAEEIPLGTAALVGFQAIDVTKRIVIPVRIEPKVYFANERTFLTWLHFVIVLCSTALGLLNFGDKVGQTAGVMFTLVAFLFMLHALFLQQWRAEMISMRGNKPFDDVWGPTVLSIVLIVAVGLNLYLKFPIIKKKLIGPVGFSNLPNQVHRKSIKKGFQFTVMVVGESGLGKSTLVNTLFNTSLYPAKDSKVELTNEIPSTVEIQAIAADIEENGVKLKLTVVDTPGFGDFINNEESWAPILENIEARFDAFLDQENRVNRKRIVDTRVHACLYFIAPTGHALKPLDIEFMKRLAGRVNLIPVVAKSDTLTEEELKLFKSRILDDIAANKINIYQPPTYENDDPETIQENKEIVSRIPFAVVGADRDIDMGNGRKIRGRKYPWGIIEVDNEEHCDFVKLRQMLIRTHMEELKEFTNEVLYESYRTAKLAETGGDIAVHSNPMKKLEADKAAHDAKLAKMESEMKAVFDQKVAEKEAKLKQAEEELYARHREMKEQLELKQRRMSPKPVQTPKKGFFSK
ncbi:hypothetical protein CcCBS67573_g05414 [Chytriomyces confervae]|uniref:SPX domain-containing protein n=1 Tax=Chytriomyces confervae TaxID=246404 RepID=A0A507FAU8_9FUNG|nr:hypothetical protein CcCBS67573_g05414 [Chytriomyces confervae]